MSLFGLNYSISVARYSSAKSGFTLLEVIIAMVIFATVIAGGVSCLRMGLAQVDLARSETRASQVMQSEIERLRSLAWEDLIKLDGSDQTVTLSDEFVGTDYQSFSLKRSVTGSGNSRKIALNIEWNGFRHKGHARSYVTQYAKGGLYDYIQ